MPPVFTHQPVLLSAVIEGLNIQPDGTYIDATFGRGGHSRAILEKLGPQGQLIAIDKDLEAITAAQQISDTRFSVFHGAFAQMQQWIKKERKINGILLDLGVSSPQFDNPDRGFSFRLEGPLDMRMNTQVGITLFDWLKTVSEKELCRVIKTYGEERFAGRIAKSIITERQKKMIESTTALAGIIAKAHPAWERDKHPATRTFQALRIFINHELEELKNVLGQCLNLLKPQGRLLVISFHSLEDRIVKRFVQQEIHGSEAEQKLPLTETERHKRLRIIGRPIRPDAAEVKQNPRARSAILRIVEKIK